MKKISPVLIYTLLIIVSIVAIIHGMYVIGNGDVENGLIPLILGAVFTIVFINQRIRASHSYCPKCGYHYDYEDDVAYESTGSHVTPGKYGQLVQHVKFNCYCRACGNIHSFRQDFTAAVSNGSYVEEKDVESQIRRHFM